ncbi:hypothetical protein MTR_5g078070 [Medicago truncatula]|uniref:Uncharacterized protein n=1 Tax=Medicago truncatula TaxID=3880 RepID=G7KG43_MEDTR|nr:hypothetical protein MTR_5g078070 [Medicago truncatula]
MKIAASDETSPIKSHPRSIYLDLKLISSNSWSCKGLVLIFSAVVHTLFKPAPSNKLQNRSPNTPPLTPNSFLNSIKFYKLYEINLD